MLPTKFDHHFPFLVLTEPKVEALKQHVFNVITFNFCKTDANQGMNQNGKFLKYLLQFLLIYFLLDIFLFESVNRQSSINFCCVTKITNEDKTIIIIIIIKIVFVLIIITIIKLVIYNNNM